MTKWFSTLNNNFKGIILAFIGFSCFALADANAKFLTLTYEPEHVVGTVAIFSSLFCLALSPFLGGLKATLQTKKLKFHLSRGILNSIVSLLVVYSFSKLTLAGTYSMIFMMPFIATLIAIPIFGEAVHKHGWIAIIGGFLGVLIVVRPGLADVNPYLFVPLIAAFFIALLFLCARPLDHKETLISLAFYPAFSNVIFITPLVIALYGLPALSDLSMYAIQALLVIGGLTLTALAFRIAKASVVSPFIYSEIVWAIGFDYYVFEDLPDIWTFIGGAIIIASGIYLIETERRQMKLEHERV